MTNSFILITLLLQSIVIKERENPIWSEGYNLPEVEIIYHVYEIVTVFLILWNSKGNKLPTAYSLTYLFFMPE